MKSKVVYLNKLFAILLSISLFVASMPHNLYSSNSLAPPSAADVPASLTSSQNTNIQNTSEFLNPHFEKVAVEKRSSWLSAITGSKIFKIIKPVRTFDTKGRINNSSFREWVNAFAVILAIPLIIIGMAVSGDIVINFYNSLIMHIDMFRTYMESAQLLDLYHLKSQIMHLNQALQAQSPDNKNLVIIGLAVGISKLKTVIGTGKTVGKHEEEIKTLFQKAGQDKAVYDQIIIHSEEVIKILIKNPKKNIDELLVFYNFMVRAYTLNHRFQKVRDLFVTIINLAKRAGFQLTEESFIVKNYRMAEANYRYYEEGDKEFYLDYLRKLLKSDPNNMFARTQLMSVLLQYEYWDEAETVANEFLKKVEEIEKRARSSGYGFMNASLPDELKLPENPIPENLETLRPKGLIALGRIFGSRGKYDAAEDNLLEATRLLPEDCEAYFWLGKLETAKGAFEKALGHFDTAEKYGANLQDVEAARIELYIDSGDLDKARGKFDELFRQRPENGELIDKFVNYLKTAEDISGFFERPLSSQDNQFIKTITNTLQISCAKMKKSVSQNNIVKLHKAFLLLQKNENDVVRTNAKNLYPVIKQAVCDWYTLCAEELFKNGKEDSALELIEQALRIEPNEPRALYMYGVNLVKLGNLEEGINNLEAVLKLGDSKMKKNIIQQDLRDVYFRYAGDLLEEGNIKKALSVAEKAFETAVEVERKADKEISPQNFITNFIIFFKGFNKSEDSLKTGIEFLGRISAKYEKQTKNKSFVAALVYYALAYLHLDICRNRNLLGSGEVFEFANKALRIQLQHEESKIMIAYFINKLLGDAFFRIPAYKQSKRYYEACINSGVKEEFLKQIRVMVGYADIKLGETKKGITTLENLKYAGQLEVNYQIARLFSLSEAHLDLGQFPAAVDYCKQALTIVKNNKNIPDSYIIGLLGKVYFKQGEFPKAKEYIENSLQAEAVNLGFMAESESAEIEDIIKLLVSEQDKIPIFNLQPLSEILMTLSSVYAAEVDNQAVAEMAKEISLELGKKDVKQRRELRNSSEKIDFSVCVEASDEVLLELADESYKSMDIGFWVEIVFELLERECKKIVQYINKILPDLERKRRIIKANIFKNFANIKKQRDVLQNKRKAALDKLITPEIRQGFAEAMGVKAQEYINKAKDQMFNEGRSEEIDELVFLAWWMFIKNTNENIIRELSEKQIRECVLNSVSNGTQNEVIKTLEQIITEEKILKRAENIFDKELRSALVEVFVPGYDLDSTIKKAVAEEIAAGEGEENLKNSLLYFIWEQYIADTYPAIVELIDERIISRAILDSFSNNDWNSIIEIITDAAMNKLYIGYPQYSRLLEIDTDLVTNLLKGLKSKEDLMNKLDKEARKTGWKGSVYEFNIGENKLICAVFYVLDGEKNIRKESNEYYGELVIDLTNFGVDDELFLKHKENIKEDIIKYKIYDLWEKYQLDVICLGVQPQGISEKDYENNLDNIQQRFVSLFLKIRKDKIKESVEKGKKLVEDADKEQGLRRDIYSPIGVRQAFFVERDDVKDIIYKYKSGKNKSSVNIPNVIVMHEGRDSATISMLNKGRKGKKEYIPYGRKHIAEHIASRAQNTIDTEQTAEMKGIFGAKLKNYIVTNMDDEVKDNIALTLLWGEFIPGGNRKYFTYHDIKEEKIMVVVVAPNCTIERIAEFGVDQHLACNLYIHTGFSDVACRIFAALLSGQEEIKYNLREPLHFSEEDVKTILSGRTAKGELIKRSIFYRFDKGTLYVTNRETDQVVEIDKTGMCVWAGGLSAIRSNLSKENNISFVIDENISSPKENNGNLIKGSISSALLFSLLLISLVAAWFIPKVAYHQKAVEYAERNLISVKNIDFRSKKKSKVIPETESVIKINLNDYQPGVVGRNLAKLQIHSRSL
ncbi:MAG: tetratricopeptide repeat protein [bacterium]